MSLLRDNNDDLTIEFELRELKEATVETGVQQLIDDYKAIIDVIIKTNGNVHAAMPQIRTMLNDCKRYLLSL